MEHLLLYTYWDFRIKFCCVKKRFWFYFDQSESRNDFFTRDFSNSCENPVRVRFPWSNLYIFSPQISLIINSASLMRCCECTCFTSAWNSIANKLKIRCDTYLSSKLWSSQLWTQFKQLRIEAWKSQDFNGVWTRDGFKRSRIQSPLKSWPFQASTRNCLNLLS